MLRATVVACASLAALTVIVGCASATDVRSEAGTTASGPRPAPDSDETTRVATRPSESAPSPENTPTEASPTTPPPDRPRKQLPNTVGALPSFQLPSRNIGCVIGKVYVRCDIVDRRYRDPRPPPNCRGDYGSAVGVTRRGIARFLCISDTVIDRSAPVLQYRTSTEVGDFGCTSRLTGVYCYQLVNRHGFRLSQDAPSLF